MFVLLLVQKILISSKSRVVVAFFICNLNRFTCTSSANCSSLTRITNVCTFCSLSFSKCKYVSFSRLFKRNGLIFERQPNTPWSLSNCSTLNALLQILHSQRNNKIRSMNVHESPMDKDKASINTHQFG